MYEIASNTRLYIRRTATYGMHIRCTPTLSFGISDKAAVFA